MFIFIVCAVSSSNAQCSKNLKPQICEFDEGVDLNASACKEVNEASVIADIGGVSSKCRTAIKADGNGCIEAFYTFMCSYRCKTCGSSINVCGDVCKNMGDECESATAMGCFTNLFSNCDNGSGTCNAIDINSDNIKTSEGSDSGNNQNNAGARPVHFLRSLAQLF